MTEAKKSLPKAKRRLRELWFHQTVGPFERTKSNPYLDSGLPTSHSNENAQKEMFLYLKSQAGVEGTCSNGVSHSGESLKFGKHGFYFRKDLYGTGRDSLPVISTDPRVQYP